MTAEPVALSFFDPAHELHGIARAGLTLIFKGGKSPTVPGEAELEQDGEGYRARLGERLELSFSPVGHEMALTGAGARLCRVTGRLDDLTLDCLGTAVTTRTAPAWTELDALRTVSAVFDEDHAVLAQARRPRGAPGHGAEIVSAALLAAGELAGVEDARISTVYDGGGRQRSAGLELWLPGEDFPRRLAGEAVSGTTLSLEGLLVNVAVFAWRMEGREGWGAYELTARDEPEAA